MCLSSRAHQRTNPTVYNWNYLSSRAPQRTNPTVYKWNYLSSRAPQRTNPTVYNWNYLSIMNGLTPSVLVRCRAWVSRGCAIAVFYILLLLLIINVIYNTQYRGIRDNLCDKSVLEVCVVKIPLTMLRYVTETVMPKVSAVLF